MKRTLKELELNIPTISLLETRKITGGYDGGHGDSIYPDDGWWHGSPGEENNPYEIPDVVVAPELPEYGYDPHENDPQEREDPDMDRHDDSDQGKDDGGDGRDDGGYDVKAATDYLRAHAHSTSQGQCARAVREALEAGGLCTDGRPGSAKDYDSFLPSLGFYEVDPNNYIPQAGDIVVHEAKEGHEHGHIAMYDGSDWISDFIQRDMFGGSAYRNDPDYSIWRR
jgi:putative cytoplasmic protein